MKKILAILAVLMMLCACSSPEIPENTTESVITPPPVEADVSDVKNDEPTAAEEIPDGYETVDFGEFSVLVCDDSFSGCAPMETVTMENNQFIGDDGENKRVIAELLSVENIADAGDPFAPYDETYSTAVNTEELSFNEHPAKMYHIQSQIDPSSSVFSNNIFYCIHFHDKMITFAFYPVMGYGGFHTDNIEAVLATIQ